MKKKALIIGNNGAIGSALVNQLKLDYETCSISLRNSDNIELALSEKYNELSAYSFSLIICCIGVLHSELVSPEKKLDDLTETGLSEYFRVNTILPALCMRYFFPLLDKKSEAKYVSLSAMVGSIKDNRLGGWYGYRSSKAALNMMVKTASVELKRINKTASVIALHPGTTKGALSKPFASNVADDKYYDTTTTAKRILAVANQIAPQDSGGFFNWDGTRIPW